MHTRKRLDFNLLDGLRHSRSLDHWEKSFTGVLAKWVMQNHVTLKACLTGGLTVACLLCFGCCNVEKLEVSKVGTYPPSTKIPLAVELRMTQEYRQAKWSENYTGGASTIEFGDHLVFNTEDCMTALFASCVSTKAENDAPLAPGTKAVVVSRMTDVGLVMPGGGVDNVITTMAVEFALNDRTGKLIWVNTFKAESRGPIEGTSSWNPMKNIQMRFDLMMRNIFTKAFDEIIKSPEVAAFASRTDRVSQ